MALRLALGRRRGPRDLIVEDAVGIEDALVGGLDCLLDVNVLLRFDEVHQLIGVLADDDRPEVAGHVVPGDLLPLAVVADGQAGLVVVLLQALDGDADVKFGVDRALLDALKVIRLGLTAPVILKKNIT